VMAETIRRLRENRQAWRPARYGAGQDTPNAVNADVSFDAIAVVSAYHVA